METDRLLTPSKEVQKSVDALWQMVRNAGDILAAKQERDAEMQTRLSVLEAELEAKNDLIATQTSTIERWKEEVATVDDLRATLKSMYERVNDLQSTLNAREERILQLEQDAVIQGQSLEEIELLQARLRAAESELTAWQTRAENMEQSLQQRGLQVAESENEVRVIRAELAALRAESELRQNTSHGEIQELLQTAADLGRQLSARESSVQQSQEEQLRLQKELEDLRVKLQRQDDATTEYKSQLMEMTARMYEREKQAVLAEERVKELESQAEEHDAGVDSQELQLRTELNEYKFKVEQFESELNALRTDIHTVTQQRDELTRAAEALPRHEREDGQTDVVVSDGPFSQLAQSIRQTAEYLAKGDNASASSGLSLLGSHKESVHGIVDKLRSAVQILESAIAA